MNIATKHIRHGVGSVRPYLYGRLDMLELVKRAFGAVELERLEAGNGYHVEAKIGDSMVVMEVGDPPHPDGTPASIYVYIDDVDAAYQ
ncbi:MAG: VOC family protein, partial [Gaiellaceae bacterium]